MAIKAWIFVRSSESNPKNLAPQLIDLWNTGLTIISEIGIEDIHGILLIRNYPQP